MLARIKAEEAHKLSERIRALVGADCILGNEMRGQVVAVSPVIATYTNDVENSIDISRFRIRLDWGPTVTLHGFHIASIKRVR